MTDAPSAGGVRPIETRVLAVAGRELVIPVAPTGDLNPAGRTVRLDFDDEQRLIGELRRLYVLRSGEAPRWLSSARTWWTLGMEGAGPGAPISESAWLDVIVVDLPADIDGRSVKLGGRPIEFDWRRAPTDGHDYFSGAMTPGALDSAQAKVRLFGLLKPAMNDPFFRWRIRLLADRLEQAGNTALADRIREVRFESPAIEALAQQIELRARLGLQRLALIDALTAQEFARALTRIGAMERELVAPTWTPINRGEDRTGLTQLLESLLDETVGDADLLRRVEAWLATQPTAVAWVFDDAGRASIANDIALSQMRVVDLSGVGAIGVASLGDGPPGPQVMIGPMGFATVVASSPLASAPRFATVRLGDWSARAPIVAGAIEAKPPGVRLSVMYEPWSLGGWLGGTPAPAPINEQTAAILRRNTDGSWELYLECRTLSEAPRAGDLVRLWMGPIDQPHAVLQLHRAGYVIDELEQVQEGEAPTRQPIDVRQFGDRWICVLPIPAEAIESGGFLRLAIERTNDAGARSTWPRPVEPWRLTPGRALIDLRRWMGLAPGR